MTLNEIMRCPIYEPRPRWCGGVFGYVAHRFPIRGGISTIEVMVRQSMRPSSLWALLMRKVSSS